MLQNNPKMQYKSQKPALLQKFPKKVLNNTTVKQLGGGNEAIEVFPPEIFFKDIEANQNYEVTVTIRNLTKQMKRVMVTQPKTRKFHLEYENTGSIAAGLSMKMSIQFETNEEGDFDDMIQIFTEGTSEPYQLLMHALKPAADIQFEPLVNMKFIPPGTEKTEYIEFKNEGRMAGYVSLTKEGVDKPPMSIEPVEFNIEPDQIQRVRVGLTAADSDVISRKITVKIDGQESSKQTIEVTATCVQQNISIVFEEGGGQKSSLNFGTLYMGERREYPAFIVNNGPQPAPFKFKFLQGLRNLEENYDDEDSNFVSPAEVGKELTDRVLTAEPLSGMVPPYQQVPVTFICRTKKHDKKGGFSDYATAPGGENQSELGKPGSAETGKRSDMTGGSINANAETRSRFQIKPQDYASLAVVKIDEDQRVGLAHDDLKIQMMARAQYPEIKINRQNFNFGEWPCGEKRDMVLSIRNKSEDQPLDFNFTRVAQFKATPARGKLLPQAEHNITITFQPNNLGSFKNEMQLEILKGIYKIPIKMQGTSNAVGKKPKGIRGPAARPNDFNQDLQLIDDTVAAESTLNRIQKKRAPKMDPAINTLDEHQLIDKEENIKDYLRQKANRNRFNMMIQHQRLTRETDKRVVEKMKETQRAPPKTVEEIRDDPDIGMEMPELHPQFDLKHEVDQLYVEKPIGKYEPTSQNLDRMRARQSQVDNRIVKKKFKAEPTTQTEIRDCQQELSGEQLQKISAGPQKINFRNVFVKSRAVKSFNISNDLRQNIYVRLMVDQYPELRHSTPLSQVIPPGQEAGFDIIFCSDKVNQFNVPITYYINDRPFSFLVQAQADPVSLELSHKQLKFAFSDDNKSMQMSQAVQVTNYGNAPARFTWGHHSKVYVPSPQTDIVAAGSSKTVTITFCPPGPRVDEEILRLQIEDGNDQELRCVGQVNESRCVFLEKQINFGNTHVGIRTKDQTLSLKNQLRTSAIFNIKCDCEELKISPMSGKIPGDQKSIITVNFFSPVPADFSTEITVNIRGGRNMKIPVRATAIVPDITIEEPQIDFGGVTFGDHRILPLTFFNKSDITAKIELDIRNHPEFEILPPDETADDDVHSELMVPIQNEAPKYDDIQKMNFEDGDPLDGENETSDEDDDEEEAKRHFILSVRSSIRPFELRLKYTPASVDDPQNFVLPMKFSGFGEADQLKRRIKAVGVKPRFFLDPTVVNFKTKVIAKGQKPLPFHEDINIQNPDNSPVDWRVDREALEASKIFQMSPIAGTLGGGEQATVRITFNPQDPVEYVARIPLYLDDEKEKPYLVIEFRGEGADAKIYFDRREVILPPVPLDTETKATFQVLHNGYENLTLHPKLANEVGKLPIKIEFPEGAEIGVTKQKIKVEATFKFSTPLSFTTFIEFYDDEGNKFSIPISGTTDNSIFSVFSFMQRNFDEIAYKIEQGKPIRIVQEVGNSDQESAKTGGFGLPGAMGGRGGFSKGGASSVVSRTAMSLVGYNPVQLYILERNCDYIRRWFDRNMSATTIENYPQDVITQYGHQIFELITYLSGKRPPGQVNSKQLSSAIQNNAKDGLKVLLTQYEELINFLKINGAHLNTVRPEYLLHKDEYFKFLKMYPKDENMKQKTVERVFPYLSKESWITVFYQVLRIYFLNRVTAKNFKALPGVPPIDSSVDSLMTKSNIYSVSETILLKWMTYHFNMVNTMHPRVITNFDTDLQDSTVFAALIRSHYGDAAALKDFRNIFFEQSTFNLNAECIVNACSQIGITTHIAKEDIVEPSARELLLFVVQLYQTLPHYIPKATIEFPSVLGDLVTKNIELSNPSKNIISYRVELMPRNSDFSVEQTEVRIEPGQTVPFPIRFRSRISKQVKGRVIFTDKREGNVQAAAMVFELVSNVYERNSVDIITKQTKLYKAIPIDLVVENAFNQDVFFNVQIQYERNNVKGQNAGKGNSKDKNARNKKGNDQGQNALKNQSNVPDPFHIKVEQIKIKKQSQQTVQVLFLPFELGVHKANIIFTDEAVGEIQYTIIGRADLPEFLDTFVGDCNSEEQFTFKKTLNYRNDKFEQAKNQISEKDRKDRKKDMDIAGGRKESQSVQQNEPKIFEVEISNGFFQGPSQIILTDTTSQGQKQPQSTKPNSKDGKSSQQQIMEVNPNQNIFELICTPTKPASYLCYIILKSLDRTDIRLYEYKLTAIPQKIKAQLEFRVPARGGVTQDIPIVNSSNQEWKVIASLENNKGGFFQLKPSNGALMVKKQDTQYFQLTFRPNWVMETKASLTLKNDSTKEEYEYELKGIGEEPLAEDHVILTCNARETKQTQLKVKNDTDKTIKYTVWTDLQNAVGQKEFEVKAKQIFDYDLSITPLLGGVYTASITFQDSEEKFQWYTIEVRTDSPKPEAVIPLRAFIRKATSAEISLSNPLNEPITFEVFFQGEGLIGDPTFSMEPKSEATYNLIFSPLNAGDFVGNIGFLNEKVGEFWYDLELKAEENPVVNLDMLECELGKVALHNIELENPTAKELYLDCRNSNMTNFEINPDKIILNPYETLKMQIRYQPTNLDVVESGNIIFENPEVGKWEYNVEGKGLVPTIMEPQPISTAVGSSTSSMLSFKNPFKEPAHVSVHMEGEDSKIFSLLLKRNKFNIGPLGILQIPYSFSPDTMTESKAVIVVSMSKQLVWRYPLRGIAESASTAIDFVFRTRARRPIDQTLQINLPGFNIVSEEDKFHFEINVLNPAHQGLVDRSVFLDQRTESLQSAEDPIVFDLRFEPLRSFKTQVEFVIYKSSGGRWKFNAVFEALEPEMDDIISIQSPLHKTSSVSFKLTNHMKAFAEFTASFTADSAAEFVVHPKAGLLEPYGKDGTNFIVSFTPTEYGKTKIGKLIIQTEEMQWTYEIRGSHPHYKIPSVQGGRIQNRLPKDIATRISHKDKPKNFMRENLKATKYGSPARSIMGADNTQSKMRGSPGQNKSLDSPGRTKM